MTAQDLIVNLQKLDVELWVEDDKLRYSAPPGVMTDDRLQQLVENKPAIIDWLQRATRLQNVKIEPIKPVSREQPQLASFAQQRMLFIDAMMPGTGSYNVSLPLKIIGALDQAALQKSLDTIMHRHESLRTHFTNRGGEYLQLIEPEQAMPLKQLSLKNHTNKDRQEKLAELVKEERQRPFDLHSGPVIRSTLIDIAENEAVLIITIHHIVSDGWSLGVLFNELHQLYSAFSTGAELELSGLQIQYVDYSVWQRRSFVSGLLQQQASYWREKLEGFAQLELPTDFNRPQAQTFEGGHVSRRLPQDLVVSIKQLSEASGATLFMTMLAAFNVLLNRYCRQDDIVIGTPIANRNRVEVEDLIGFFVNMLVLRTDLSAATNFNSLLALVRETALEAYQNQDLPFEKLVEELKIERDLSRNPLFQVSFALQGTPEDMFRLEGLNLELLQIAEVATTRFDLEVNVTEGKGQMIIDCLFNTSLFRRNSVEKMMARFESLLQAIVAAPDQELEQLDILTAEERRRILRDWNQTKSPYPRDKNLAELFEAQAIATPDATALGFGERTLSYGELNRRANQLAHYLIACGVKTEVMVGMCIERSLDLVISMLAITKAGGAYLPLEVDYPAQRLSFMLDDAKVGILLTQSTLLGQLPEFDGHTICLDRQWSDIQQQKTDNPLVELGAENLIYVMYTSGSTGTPKGVCIEHRSVSRLVKSTNYIDAGPDDIFLLSAPVSFDASTLEIWGSLLNGAKLVIYPEPKISLAQLGRVLQEDAITTLWLTSALFSQMVEQQLDSFRGVKTLLAGGEALSINHVRKYLAFLRDNALTDHKLVNGYGPTENTTFTCCHVMDGDSVLDNTVPIGRPISNSFVFILDESRNLVPPGITGELYIGGDGLARGYLNRPELTAEKFVTQDFDEGEAVRLYRTGDLVRYSEDGDVIFVGRADSQIKLRGYRIELGEIESLLNEHTAVSEALVMLREDIVDDRRLVAYLVFENGSAADVSAIREYCQQRLPTYMLPSAFVVLDAFPVTSNGKIDRTALVAPSGERQIKSKFVAANGELELAIADIWKSLLGLDEVGVNDNFFDLGGHSLLLINFQARLSERLDMEVSIIDLFRYTTIEALARFLDGQMASVSTADKVEQRMRHRRERGLEDDTIAVVGMAGRFPGAQNLERFWQNLVEGVESIRFFNEDELRAAGIPEQLIQNPAFVPARGYLDDAELFDADFFGYSASEAELIDPQQRIFLETAVHALEHAACDPRTCDGMIAVFAGASANTYLDNIRTRPDILSAAGMQVFISSEKDFIATRVSYKLGLKGPGLTIQTACSTSLVAIHEACRSLQHFDCDVALAGGVSVAVPRVNGYIYQQDSILSPDGHCRSFDENANGTVSGEGVGVVVLKRLKDALADRDSIHAIVKGSAINNDGADKAGYTAPGIQGQANVIEMAQAAAGVAADSIGYVETHGTATSLGDPIEVSALTQAFSRTAVVSGHKHCALGAVKQNLGHLDSAAGVASFIKAVLAIEHATIPPAPHFTVANPQIDFDKGPFFVNTVASEWPSSSALPRRAGVSSFGIGGTNAHVILEQAPELAQDAETNDSSGPVCEELIVLSAKTASALQRRIGQLGDFLQDNPNSRLDDVAYTLQTGRTMYQHRAMLVGDDTAAVAGQLLEGKTDCLSSGEREASPRNIVFMFSGQGAQYPDMARGLYLRFPEFRDSVDACCEILRAHLERDLRELLFPLDTKKALAKEQLTQTRYAQCSLFVIEYATASLWRAWGVEPAAMIGHSVGEYVAACLAGVFSLEDALMLVAGRGRLMQAQPPGTMLSISLGAAEVESLLSDELRQKISIATVNAPSMCVVSGAPVDIELFRQVLQAGKHDFSLLHTSHAFHSSMMDPVLDPFAELLDDISLHAPKIAFVSNLTGTWIEPGQAIDPSYWTRHLRDTVLFSDGIKTLLREKFNCFIELGPGNTLATFARQNLGSTANATEISVLSSIRHPRQDQADSAFILNSLGRLWLAGHPLDWKVVNHSRTARRIPLPVYPFDRKRYWIEARPVQLTTGGLQAGKIGDIDKWAYAPAWKSSQMLVETSPRQMSGDWIVFANDSISSKTLISYLEQQGGRVIKVSAGDSFIASSSSDYTLNPSRRQDYDRLFTDGIQDFDQVKGLIHCWGMSSARVDDTCVDMNVMQLEFYSLLYIAQALVNSRRSPSLHIDVLTEYSQAVDRDDRLVPEKSMAAAMLRVICQENIGIRFTLHDLLDTDIKATLEQSACLNGLPPELQSILSSSRQDGENRVIAYRRNRRWLQIFERAVLNQDRSDQFPAQLREKGVYLITGGLGGVGFVMANYLAATVSARLVLTARTRLPDPARWDDYLAMHDNSDKVRRILAQLRHLQSLGAEVLVKTVDANDPEGMRHLVEEAAAKYGQVNGVIHAAGIVSGESMQSMQSLNPEVCELQFAAKVHGLKLLQQIFDDYPVDFVMPVSSLSAILGGLGFAAYSAANQYMDSLCQQQHNRGKTKWISVDWDGWLFDEIDEAGAPRSIADRAAGSRFFLTADEGQKLLAQIFNSPIMPQLIISTGDLDARLEQWVYSLPAESDGAVADDNRYERPELSTGFSEAETQTQLQLSAIWKDLFKLSQIGIHDNFFELGGHSLLAVQAVAAIRDRFHTSLSIEKFLELGTIEKIASHIDALTWARSDEREFADDETREEFEL